MISIWPTSIPATATTLELEDAGQAAAAGHAGRDGIEPAAR